MQCMMITTSHQYQCRPFPCPQQPCLSVLFLSLFLLVAFAQAQAPTPPPPPPPPGGPPIYHVYWDIRTETFEDLRQKLMPMLLLHANMNPYNPQTLNQIPVLGPRRLDHYDAPPAWIYIHVKAGDAQEEQVTLAMAIDDLYILGFCNGAGVWYQLSGGKENTFKGLPPGTHVLKIQENYRDLIKGGRPALPTVPLGKNSATHATLQLGAYDHRTSPDEAQVQDGLVRFVVMIGEGMRLRRIRETFSGNNWDKETFISLDNANSVVDWGSSSRLVIRWFLTGGARRGRWGGGWRYEKVADKVRENSKIFRPRDAFNNRYDLWLRPRETVAQLVSNY